MATNQAKITLASGVGVEYPIIATAYSWAMLVFSGSTANAGEQLTITCGGKSVVLTLDSDGKGELSLLPFIRDDVYTRCALIDPLGVVTGKPRCDNPMRGVLDITIGEQSVKIYYLFGCASPFAPQGDVWLTYDEDSVMSIDEDTSFSGITPTSSVEWIANVRNTWRYLASQGIALGTGIDVEARIVSVMLYGDTTIDRITTYHMRYDCRVGDNIVRVRWIDHYGNINERKLCLGSDSAGAARADAYATPHNVKVVTSLNDPYWHGNDQWQEVAPTRSINVGDDAIPIEQREWLATLVQSSMVAVNLGDDVWRKVQLADSTLETDQRRATFDLSLTLQLDAPAAQQF